MSQLSPAESFRSRLHQSPTQRSSGKAGVIGVKALPISSARPESKVDAIKKEYVSRFNEKNKHLLEEIAIDIAYLKEHSSKVNEA